MHNIDIQRTIRGRMEDEGQRKVFLMFKFFMFHNKI